jgi:hypothetical protein
MSLYWCHVGHENSVKKVLSEQSNQRFDNKRRYSEYDSKLKWKAIKMRNVLRQMAYLLRELLRHRLYQEKIIRHIQFMYEHLLSLDIWQLEKVYHGLIDLSAVVMVNQELTVDLLKKKLIKMYKSIGVGEESENDTDADVNFFAELDDLYTM